MKRKTTEEPKPVPAVRHTETDKNFVAHEAWVPGAATIKMIETPRSEFVEFSIYPTQGLGAPTCFTIRRRHMVELGELFKAVGERK